MKTIFLFTITLLSLSGFSKSNFNVEGNYKCHHISIWADDGTSLLSSESNLTSLKITENVESNEIEISTVNGTTKHSIVNSDNSILKISAVETEKLFNAYRTVDYTFIQNGDNNTKILVEGYLIASKQAHKYMLECLKK